MEISVAQKQITEGERLKSLKNHNGWTVIHNFLMDLRKECEQITNIDTTVDPLELKYQISLQKEKIRLIDSIYEYMDSIINNGNLVKIALENLQNKKEG